MSTEALLLLHQGERTPFKIVDPDDSDDEHGGRGRIRCPKCGWEPARGDTWACTCLHVWNTFDTGGVCPACSREWRETQCPRCKAWSRHQEWYEDEPEP